MINTYNETHLHRTLKQLYMPVNAQEEVPIRGYICDIFTAERTIIEIQTEQFLSLNKKLKCLLPYYSIEIIYPIIETNFILLLNADSTVRSYRKSPKHGCIFQVFKELLSIFCFIREPNLHITLLYIDCQTVKIDDKTGRSRYKNPRILDKTILKINKEEHIKDYSIFCNSVLSQIPDTFTRKDITMLAGKRHSSFVLSFLKKCNAIVHNGKIGRSFVYKKAEAFKNF